MNWWKSSWFLLVGAIVYLSLKPASHQNLVEVNDKVGHFLAYFVLFIYTHIFFPKWKIGGAALFSFLLSCSLELLQHFSPGRTVSIWDVVANGTGVLMGIAFYLLFKKWIVKLLKLLRIENS